MTEVRKRNAAKIVRLLRRDYPDAVCALAYETPLQLLVATILSAQCTDERVNAVTPKLFQTYRTARDFARASQDELEELIRSTGFFRNKASNIRACCTAIDELYGGQVPKDLKLLVNLPGIGRKTANVVLGTAFGLPTGVVVDTHVKRLSHRLGLTEHKVPEKIELDLIQCLPRKEWIDFSHRMIHHGRQVCRARKPLCERCGLRDVCPQIGVSSL